MGLTFKANLNCTLHLLVQLGLVHRLVLLVGIAAPLLVILWVLGGITLDDLNLK